MTQGENKQEKPQIISEFSNNLVLIAVIKLFSFKSHYLHRRKGNIYLHDYKIYSDFKPHVWAFFLFRSTKIDGGIKVLVLFGVCYCVY